MEMQLRLVFDGLNYLTFIDEIKATIGKPNDLSCEFFFYLIKKEMMEVNYVTLNLKLSNMNTNANRGIRNLIIEIRCDSAAKRTKQCHFGFGPRCKGIYMHL